MEEWDNIDWDEKVNDIVKNQKKPTEKVKKDESSNEIAVFQYSEDDGNYYETNSEKKRIREARKVESKAGQSSKSTRTDSTYIQPYSLKDLIRIREFVKSPNVHHLVHETFGQFEKLLLTHQTDLIYEAIVELLNIDVSLLEIPFHSHNQLLLREISKIEFFWSQLIHFLKDFLDNKHKDLMFLLTVDMNGFIENIEYIMHSLLVNNFFNSQMELVFKELIDVMKSFSGSKWSQPERLQDLHSEYERNLKVFKIYDIYPSVADLKTSRDNLSGNIIEGEYQNVSHYLQVQLPLLKEDFISKLRDGVKQLKSLEPNSEILKTPNVWIHWNVQITTETEFLWNMSCRSIVVRLNLNQKIDWNRRFFNGQILCFSSSKDFNDLVIAIVTRRTAASCINCKTLQTSLYPNNAQAESVCNACTANSKLRNTTTGTQVDNIQIEIIQAENISDFFNRDLIMLEPLTFFEPYHRVFNVMKNLNELNFPFKEEILKLNKNQDFPEYQHPDHYSYKEFSFPVKNINEWPSNTQLKLELMQLKAVQAAVTNKFTIIQGPPGTGKTFVGLEILKILLENTNETILILTQTNNALDKFLLGASKFTDSVARMGGQCKCDELEQFIFKPSTPLESKKYMKKLQFQLKNEVTKLLGSDQNNDEVHQKISLHHRLIEEINQLSSFYSIRDKKVVGMTTTFAARNSSINKLLKPGIVIIEEASEVLESHVLVSLTRETKQVIMIGDHQQLKPLTSSYELAKNFDFDVSLFERLIRNDYNFTTLDVQMRMRPDICDLVRGTIYKTLKDGANVATYPSVKGMPINFFCVSHSHLESVGHGETSKENAFEAEYIVQLCDHLIKEGNDSSQITILTVYAAQAQRIKRRLNDFPAFNVRVAVLDAYQGEESDIILLSLVRSNTRREIGFLSSENRIAVVLSRAKFGLYIVANMECLASASSTWKRILEIMKKKQVIGDAIPYVNIVTEFS